MGASDARNVRTRRATFTAEVNAAPAIARVRAQATTAAASAWRGATMNTVGTAPKTSSAATGTAINLLRIDPLSMRHPKPSGRSPSRYLSAGSVVP